MSNFISTAQNVFGNNTMKQKVKSIYIAARLPFPSTKMCGCFSKYGVYAICSVFSSSLGFLILKRDSLPWLGKDLASRTRHQTK